MPEFMAENLEAHRVGDEIHPGETVEEKVSLSERFGLWISFYPFSQAEDLAIVEQWLRHFGVDERGVAAARQPSLVWALERGSRSGRVAYQFARDWAGRDHRDDEPAGAVLRRAGARRPGPCLSARPATRGR